LLNLAGMLREDMRTVFAGDPAARNMLEVLFCYPGLHALWNHRIAHYLWCHRLRLIGRLLSHANRFITGIEIHPGAAVGRRFFIDHGMGVVIGETSEIGDDVLMYQGVVLGGTTHEKGKRHPTIADHVVLGAGATLLGAITIGQRARIGAGSVVVQDVGPGATVVGVPGRVVTGRTPSEALEHGRLPDPVSEAIGHLVDDQSGLTERLRRIEKYLDIDTAEKKPRKVDHKGMAQG